MRLFLENSYEFIKKDILISFFNYSDIKPNEILYFQKDFLNNRFTKLILNLLFYIFLIYFFISDFFEKEDSYITINIVNIIILTIDSIITYFNKKHRQI